MSDKELILKELQKLKSEALRLYEANGKKPYDSGIYNGIKWAIEVVENFKS